MFAGGYPGDGRWRKVFRGVGDAAPTVCPGMGGSGSLPLIRPCGATFPQGGRQGLLLAAAQGFAGRRGRRALRFAREWAAAGACPSSGPAGPPSPKGEGKGCCWRRRKVSRGVGDAAPTDGDMETLWGLRGHPFPGRRTVGAGHARPGGWREHPFPFYRLTPPTSPPAYSRCCRRQNRWGRSAHRPDARFRRWIRSRRASGHRRSGPEGTGVCCRCNFSSAG